MEEELASVVKKLIPIEWSIKKSDPGVVRVVANAAGVTCEANISNTDDHGFHIGFIDSSGREHLVKSSSMNMLGSTLSNYYCDVKKLASLSDWLSPYPQYDNRKLISNTTLQIKISSLKGSKHDLRIIYVYPHYHVWDINNDTDTLPIFKGGSQDIRTYIGRVYAGTLTEKTPIRSVTLPVTLPASKSRVYRLYNSIVSSLPGIIVDFDCFTVKIYLKAGQRKVGIRVKICSGVWRCSLSVDNKFITGFECYNVDSLLHPFVSDDDEKILEHVMKIVHGCEKVLPHMSIVEKNTSEMSESGQ